MRGNVLLTNGNFRMATNGIREIARDSDEYPAQLAPAPWAPEILYAVGRIAPGDALAVAIVGSRRATPYGLDVAERLGAELAVRGITVVSGLARGIDSAAHRGALEAGGRTIAVLGSGVDTIYPPENRALADRISRSGAVLSQFAPGTRPLRHHFPERNRVIAGLSLGVVVVEATERSGSLITAGFAADLGREVMAVPGRVTSPESDGTHRLIQDGAALVRGADDVIALLPERWQACVRTAATSVVPGRAPARMSGDAGAVFGALGAEPATIDDVIEQSGIPSGRVAALLLELELAGRIRQLEGKCFVRVGRG